MAEQFSFSPESIEHQPSELCSMLKVVFSSEDYNSDDLKALYVHARSCDRCSGLLFERFGLVAPIGMSEDAGAS